MTNSIFLTVKKMLGIAEEYHAFDLDIITNINSVFLNLNQLGVGPISPYQIIGEEETWDDFQGETIIPGVQSYVYLKVRLLFDPPTNSFLVDNIQKQIAEFEWRMNVQSETPAIEKENRDISTPTTPITPAQPTVNLMSRQAIPISKSNLLAQKIALTMEKQSKTKGG